MAADTIREGVFAINKPLGISSAQVIRECQQYFNPSTFFKPLIESEVSKRLNESNPDWKKRRQAKKAARVKMGHGGTLDPLATGVLLLGVGAGTKHLQGFLDCKKTYETIVLFGAGTDTYDRTGRILTKRPYDHITREAVEKELDNFRGTFEQIPPLYSALKMEGKPLYEYAREGKPIPREIIGRQVEVEDLRIVEWYEPGSHSYRWPTEEAETSEKNLAEQVWRLEKQKPNAKKLTPEEAEEDERAAAAHESQKRKFDERQDELVRDKPMKRRKSTTKETALMSGALGQLPASPAPAAQGQTNKGTNLVPEQNANDPAPWKDEGPAAVKIRMTVGSGFYVRSFCHDLGSKLNSAALMSELERSQQGDFAVGENCLEHSDLDKGEHVWAPKVSKLLAEWHAKNPNPPQKRDALRNDRNQNFAGAKKKSVKNNGGSNNNQNNKRKADQQARRNSSSGDEAGKSSAAAAAAAAPASPERDGEPAAKKTKVTGGGKEDESEWEGIKD